MRLFSILISLFLLLPLLWACGKKEDAAAEAPPAIKVKVETEAPSSVVQTATLVARLDSRHAVSLYPKVDGSISKILVSPGQAVQEGQLLLEIDATKQQAAVATKQSEIAQAKADYQKEVAALASLRAERDAQTASVEYDQHEFERNYWLEQRGVVSESTVDAKDRAAKVSKAKLHETDEKIGAQKEVIERAARAVESVRFSKKEQDEQLAFYRIRAPFSGVMADIPVKLGDYVNSQTKLTVVSQLKPLEVNLLVPKEMAPGVQIGSQVQILDDSGADIATCRVFHIDPVVDQQNQSVLVKAEFDNAAEKFRPDQSVTTKLILRNSPGILVPTEALTFVAGRAFAYVVASSDKGTIAQQRPLEIAFMQGNRAAIKSGITAGDRVVISGVQNLRDGAQITIE